jgi:hypothetical protein
MLRCNTGGCSVADDRPASERHQNQIRVPPRGAVSMGLGTERNPPDWAGRDARGSGDQLHYPRPPAMTTFLMMQRPGGRRSG